MRTRRTRAVPSTKTGWSYSNQSQEAPPRRKLKAFKAGEIIPQGATYLTFAIKNDTPHFFFLLPHSDKKKPKSTIGFRLN